MDELLNCILNDVDDDNDINLSIVDNNDGSGRQVLATRPLAPGDIIGPSRGLPVESVLDPVEILKCHPMGRMVLGIPPAPSDDDGSRNIDDKKRIVEQKMAFWMTLAVMGKEAAERQHDRLHKEKVGGAYYAHGDGQESARMKRRRCGDNESRLPDRQERVFDAYLLSLPREGPDPCCWSETDRSQLLVGTPLGKQIETTLTELREEYDRVVRLVEVSVSSGELPPFSIQGRGIFPSVLWARSMHVSRAFPRSLVDEEGVWWVGQKNYIPPPPSPSSSRPSSSPSHNGNGDGINGSPTILSIRLGGWKAPVITRQQEIIEQSSPPQESHLQNKLQSSSPQEKYGSTLGIMLPLLDMMDHKPCHAVQWEAFAVTTMATTTHSNNDNNNTRQQRRRIRFRCVHPIAKGEPIWNNYGPKGNGELLGTYGFATKDNVMDSVEGIVFGLRTPVQSDNDGNSTNDTHTEKKTDDDHDGVHKQEVQVYEARMALIKEHSLPHRFEKDGSLLLLGPFELHRKLSAINDATSTDNPNSTPECSDEGGVIPEELYNALSLIGLEDVEEGPIISEDELEMLREVLTKKLDGFGPPSIVMPAAAASCSETEGKVAAKNDLDSSTLNGVVAAEASATPTVKSAPSEYYLQRAESVKAYKDGQRKLLHLALAELDALMPSQEDD